MFRSALPGIRSFSANERPTAPVPVKSRELETGRAYGNGASRSHAILAHTVRIALQGQLNITVAKQSLCRSWVSSNADRAVTQIVEAESPWIIIYQSAFVVSV